MAETCPRCASARWMTGVKCDTFVLVVSAAENRDFWDWKGGVKGASDLLASVCADCGYTEFHAVSPELVWAEWQKRNTPE